MSQETAFGEAALTAYMAVEKADGTTTYFRLDGEITTEIDQETYERENE